MADGASRGKVVRTEPVSALFAARRVVHVGTFGDLETEMTSWVRRDPERPNRVDALVWALTDLLLTMAPAPFAKPNPDRGRYSRAAYRA